ncbi:DMT family transporter [Kiloniella antarctica]|uniref:DMT family transporter n=1 Tax=Kiloniella antarctica TaxID=1550907 RepID=A0ABW5BMD5_9PROT
MVQNNKMTEIERVKVSMKSQDNHGDLVIDAKDHAQKTHLNGVLLIMVSAVVFSTVGIFVKGIEAPAWDIIFWRGLFSAGFTIIWTVKRGTFKKNFYNIGGSGWAAVIIGASGSAAFISALKITSIANVSLIYAAAPLVAALIAWLWVGERVTFKMFLACLFAIMGVGIIVWGSIGEANLLGDLLAFWMAFSMAIFMVIYRRFPNTPSAGPVVLSSLLLLPFAFILGNPFAVPLDELAILVAFGVVFAVASVTFTEGAKRVPSGQAALLSALETPLAPIFAWLVFAEFPAQATWVGGALILIAVSSTLWKSK